MSDISRAEDWVLVPREPTPEMIEAAEACSETFDGTEEPHSVAWRAMLAAAPAAVHATDPEIKRLTRQRDLLARKLAQCQEQMSSLTSSRHIRRHMR